MIPLSMQCKTCRVKYRQEHGMCRTCSRASGLETRNSQQRDSERLARQKARRPVVVIEAPPPALGPRDLMADGKLFEVLWSGADGSLY